MKLYVLYITFPLAMLIQHIYAEIYTTFGRWLRGCQMLMVIVPVLLAVVFYFVNPFSSAVAIEICAMPIIMLLVCKVSMKFGEPIPLYDFDRKEIFGIVIEIVMGLCFILFTFTKWYWDSIHEVCTGNEIILSKILYFALGGSYIFLNRITYVWLVRARCKNKRK